MKWNVIQLFIEEIIYLLIGKNIFIKIEIMIISDNEDFNPFNANIIIGWANGNHYELLLLNGLTNDEYPLEYQINLNSFNI